MAIEVGNLAPEFSLYNTEKTKVSLADYKGKKIVLLFFPLAFTGVCTSEMCTMRDNMSMYEQLDAEIIGISVDSLFVLGEFKKTHQLNFTLLSDFNKEVCAQYDTLFEAFAFDMQGVSKRASFVIDKEGIVRYKEVLESAGDLPNFQAIQDCVATC
ncbi:MAG: peroxiredoxin [Chitinophagaceae bacterium]